MASFYIGSPVITGTGVSVTNASPTVTGTGKFTSAAAGDLIAFDYTTSGKEYQGMWAVISVKNSSDQITLDRNMTYTGTVNFRRSSTKYQLDTINTTRISVQTSATTYGMPGQSTRKTLFYDDGAIRTITIGGKFADASANNVTTWLDAIGELQTGNQYASNPYLLCVPHLMWNTGNGAWYLVGVKSFDWTYDKPNGTAASYTLQCVERQ